MANTDRAFGPFQTWLDAPGRSARIHIYGGAWKVICREIVTVAKGYDRRRDVGVGSGATLAEACADAMNDIMRRQGR